jgi:ATP/maltotriose-dependent transcriptional regulator MalT
MAGVPYRRISSFFSAVRTHLENVFAKLNVHTRTAAVARVRELTAVD